MTFPSELKITLDADRRIKQVETSDFRVTLNGRSNADYKQLFASVGITLEFIASDLTRDTDAAIV